MCVPGLVALYSAIQAQWWPHAPLAKLLQGTSWVGFNTEDVGSTDCPYGGWGVRVYPSLLLLGLESGLFYLHSAFHLRCSLFGVLSLED